jgi:hypothetical protein
MNDFDCGYCYNIDIEFSIRMMITMIMIGINLITMIMIGINLIGINLIETVPKGMMMMMISLIMNMIKS